MNTLTLDQMSQIEGGDTCAAITGGTAGAGFVATVGGAVANGTALTWKLGGKGLLVGLVGGALAGGICYGISYFTE